MELAPLKGPDVCEWVGLTKCGLLYKKPKKVHFVKGVLWQNQHLSRLTSLYQDQPGVKKS